MSSDSKKGLSYAPTHWRRIEAINGRGAMLIGPDERSDEPGAIVIAPPGVLLRGPKGGPPLTRVGWREARWKLDEDGHVLVDQARPVALAEVQLVQVVEDLACWAPNQLTWVASVVERQLRVLIGRMSRDCHGQFHPQGADAYEELGETRRLANAAFYCLKWHPHDIPMWLTEQPFTWVERNYVAELAADRKRMQDATQGAGELESDHRFGDVVENERLDEAA